MQINIPYYHTNITVDIPDNRVKAVLKQKEYHGGGLDEQQIVEAAMQNPIQSKSLIELSKGKNNILIITSDHTRPVPSRITMPVLLKNIRQGNPSANIKILIATGFHRATTKEELADKFGDYIYNNEDIIVHDAFDASAMVSKGTLPSGGKLRINKLVDWANLIIAEGFIEPHFFAGFSGGRKSILPGISAEKTIMYNHNAQFIAHPKARIGMLEGNPLHKDMIYAANAVGISFILNVTLDKNKKIIGAFAGHPIVAHEAGCNTVRQSASVSAVKANIVISSNGGYPLDQNIYQTVKGMAAAESCVTSDGIVIMISSCCNGNGGDGFYRWFKESNSPEEVLEKIRSIPPDKTLPDQWEAQILARILNKCRHVILVSSHIDPVIVSNMNMLHASSFKQALDMTDELLGGKEPMVIIPDGVGIIIEE